MVPVPDLGRRQLLRTAGVATAAAAAGCAVGPITLTVGASFTLDARLQALIAAGRFSPELGDAYLGDERPRTAAAYAAMVEDTMGSLPEGDLETGIRHAVSRDFATGNTCSVHGWLLSLTECRLAAIAYFFRADGGCFERPARQIGLLDTLPETAVAYVERWGPQSTVVDEPFNRRPDGGSAVWLHVPQLRELATYRVHLGGRPATTFVNRQQMLITGSLTVAQAKPLISRAGRIPLHLVDPVRGKQLVGYVRVRPHAPAREPATMASGDEGRDDDD